MKPRYKKQKNAGCAPWILAGVREVFRKATEKAVTVKTPVDAHTSISSDLSPSNGLNLNEVANG